MNRLERLIRIHRLLQNRRPVPMRSFIDELRISRTTVTRDFEYLRDFLNAPILYNRELNGHHYDPQAAEFELPGFWLNQSELYALLAAEHLLESVQPGLLTPYLAPLRTRLRELLGRGGERPETVARKIKVIASGSRSAHAASFAVVAEATIAERKLRFEYHGRASDTRSRRTTSPQRLINYRNNWYLIAHCEEAAELRVFSVDRIQAPLLLDMPIIEVDDDAVDRALEGGYGIFVGAAEHRAVLRFSSTAARWVAEERWHPDQFGMWKADGFELQVPYSNPTELTMEVLRHGPDVEVIAPDSLRALVVERLRQAISNYC